MAITDLFSGGDGDPGANWTATTSAGKPTVSSGNLIAGADSSSRGMIYTGSSWGDDQSVEVILAGTINGSTYCSLMLNCTGADGTFTGYKVSFNSTNLYISRVVNGSSVDKVEILGSTTFVATNVMKAEIVSGVIKLYQNTVQRATWTEDSTLLTGGSPGIEFYDSEAGGDIAVTQWVGTGEISGGSGWHAAFAAQSNQSIG